MVAKSVLFSIIFALALFSIAVPRVEAAVVGIDLGSELFKVRTGRLLKTFCGELTETVKFSVDDNCHETVCASLLARWDQRYPDALWRSF